MDGHQVPGTDTPPKVEHLGTWKRNVVSKPDALNGWIIYLHEWLKFMVKVGKYSSPVESAYG